MKKLNIVMTLAAVAVWCAGCVMPPPNNVPPMDRRVTLAESIDGNDIFVTDMRCAKLNNSPFFTMQANVVNNTMGPYAVEWKVVWLDADGVEIDSVSNTWNRRVIQPKEILALKSVATAPNAVDMRLYIRRMK